jgi:hypothetical protein
MDLSWYEVTNDFARQIMAVSNTSTCVGDLWLLFFSRLPLEA